MLTEETKQIISAQGYYVNGVKVGCTPSEKFIILHLLSEFKEAPAGIAIVKSQAEIAKACGMEYKSVGKCIRKLLSHGLLIAVKTHQKGRAISFKYAGFNTFTLYSESGGYTVEGVRVCDLESDATPMMRKEYYVYTCKHNGTPVYVGKGKGDRLTHCLSGRSSSPALNELLFKNDIGEFEVTKLIENLSEDEALLQESAIIKAYADAGLKLCNRAYV